MKFLPTLSAVGSFIIGGMIIAQAALAAPMRIQVQGTDMCLDKRSGTNEIQIWKCGNTPDQVFDIGTAEDPNELYLREPRLCVGHTSGLAKPNDGTRVIVSSDCRFTNSWQFDGTSFSTFKFRDMVMDVINGNMSNGTRVQMYHRDGSNAQKFAIRPVGGVVSTPVVQPRPVSNPTPQNGNNNSVRVEVCNTEDTNFRYTAVLISARAGAVDNQSPKVGHTVFAMVKRWDKKLFYRQSNGTCMFTVSQAMEQISTVSSEGVGKPVIRVNNEDMDLGFVNKWKEANGRSRNNGYSFLVKDVDAEGYRLAVTKDRGGYNTTYNGLGCLFYKPITLGVLDPGCNCTTVATGVFNRVTGIKMFTTTPTSVAKEIDKYHGYSDWVDGGVGLYLDARF
jgi:hypothetical protein